MPQRNADVLEVQIAKMGKYGNINLILGKTLSVLPETELFQPVRNLLHRGPFSRIYRGPTAPLDQVDSEFMRQIRSVVVTAGLNMPSRCPRRDPPRGGGRRQALQWAPPPTRQRRRSCNGTGAKEMGHRR